MSTVALDGFRAAILAAGLDYSGPIIADGVLHRFKSNDDRERNSWYVLHPGPPAAGIFGDWKRDLKETWCERKSGLSKPECKELQQRLQQVERDREKTQAALQDKARKTAAWIIDRSRGAPARHCYLVRKRVKVYGKLHGYRAALVLPLRDINGELHSLQFIRPDGSKRFLSGGRIAGCFFTICDKADGALVLCEGYATGASIYGATGLATFAALNAGNLLLIAQAVREKYPTREIIICADNDQFTASNPGLTMATEAAKAIGARLAVPQFEKLDTKPTDFNDLALLVGVDAVKTQIQEAEKPVAAGDDDTIARLAALSPLEYERQRKVEAERLGCRESVLDGLVEAERRKKAEAGLQGRAVQFPNVEPWPKAVSGPEVLNNIAEAFQRYIALPTGAVDVLALWCAHAHVYQAFLCSPRLNISSPDRGCGKTTLRDVLSLFVARPVATENLSTAVLFRLVDAHAPVILADEYDAWLKDNEELRGLLNAGHRRGANVFRCEGDNHEIRAFAAYAPAVLCGIGALPGTLHERSIVVRLERAKLGELGARFDSRHTEREQELCRKLARFCADNFARIESSDPALPAGIFNRLADNWRPLFAIAEVAGGDWPRRCADAFAKLNSRQEGDAESIGTLLLADVRQVFAGTWQAPDEDQSAIAVERIFSRELVQSLCQMKDRPWPEAQRGGPISERWLARHLARFGIHPKTLRINEGRAKGYEADDFKEAFERYVVVSELAKRDTVTCEWKGDFSSVTSNSGVTDRETPPTERMSRCHGQKALVDEAI